MGMIFAVIFAVIVTVGGGYVFTSKVGQEAPSLEVVKVEYANSVQEEPEESEAPTPPSTAPTQPRAVTQESVVTPVPVYKPAEDVPEYILPTSQDDTEFREAETLRVREQEELTKKINKLVKDCNEKQNAYEINKIELQESYYPYVDAVRRDPVSNRVAEARIAKKAEDIANAVAQIELEQQRLYIECQRDLSALQENAD